MQTKVDAAKLLVYRTKQAKQDNEAYEHYAAMAKLFAAETAMNITELYEGTSEVPKMVISA